MLPKLLSIGLLLSVTLASFAQDAKDIIRRAYNKCQSIKNGYYEMDNYWKPMATKDTFKTVATCYFKKLKNDSLHASAFHTRHFWKGQHTADILYTGNDMVRLTPYDSVATIHAKALWRDQIKETVSGRSFNAPVADWERSPMPLIASFTDQKHTFKFVGEEAINQSACYHIQMNEMPENKSTEASKTIRIEKHYWIKKEDLIPIQYLTVYDVVMNNDTMCDYQMTTITKYEVNNLKDEHILTMGSIPAWYKMKDYVPTVYPKLLPRDTTAPNYTLQSMIDESISLNGLKGKLVLMDFFYKGCYPCMQALPGLQALHEKYEGKGLKVVGIDPFDKDKDDIAAFLAKRNITYSVSLSGEDIAKDYHVSMYPTMYLIDKNGKIIFVQEGYSPDVEKALEEAILQNL